MSIRFSRLPLIAIMGAMAAFSPITLAAAEPRAPVPGIDSPDSYLTGSPLALRVTGLPSQTWVRLAATRRLLKWVQDAEGRWSQVPVNLISWGEFRSDRRGTVDLATQGPRAGTWRRADARDLLWSGVPVASVAGGRALPATVVRLEASVDGRVVASRDMTLRDSEPGLVRETISLNGLNAAYAAPAGPGPFPVMLVLHGSEGGDRDMAISQAGRFASRGFATLAINYFAWPYKQLPGIPTEHINLPLETLVLARDWLAGRAEADLDRVGVWGVSKGAEFAAVAASAFDWIDAVVACVGSDVVWEGYGRPVQAGDIASSWARAGQPLPYIPLPAEDPTGQIWRTNTARYEAGLASVTPVRRAEAAIRFEDARARFLFIGSDRDEVWASGRMARAAAQRLRRLGRAEQIDTLVFRRSGHMICGDGSFPGQLYGVQRSEPWAKSLLAEGEDQLTAWDRTLRFLHATLGQRGAPH